MSGISTQLYIGKKPRIIFTAITKIPIPMISLIIELIPRDTGKTFEGKDTFLIKEALSKMTVVDLWTVSWKAFQAKNPQKRYSA